MIFANSCPSCLAQASQNACGSFRTASSSALVCAFALATKRKRRETPQRKCFILDPSGAIQKRTNGFSRLRSAIVTRCRRILQFFPCVGKHLRVHSHLPACSEAAGEKTSSGAER